MTHEQDSGEVAESGESEAVEGGVWRVMPPGCVWKPALVGVVGISGGEVGEAQRGGARWGGGAGADRGAGGVAGAFDYDGSGVEVLLPEETG